MKTYIVPDTTAKAPEIESYIERMLDINLTPTNRKDVETTIAIPTITGIIINLFITYKILIQR